MTGTPAPSGAYAHVGHRVSDGETLPTALLPLLRNGLERGDPVVLACGPGTAAALQDALAARGLAEQRLSETAVQPPDTPAPRPRVKRAASVKSTPRAQGAKGREPKPVKWWLPDYKATTKEG